MSNIKSIDEFFGRNVSYSDEKKAEYLKLQNDRSSPFKDCPLSDIFVYAAVLGFELKQREKLKRPKPNVVSHAFTREQKAILLTIAISTESIDILLDHKHTTKIIEEYANYGINHIAEEWLGRQGQDPVIQICHKIENIIDEIEPNLASTQIQI